MNTFIIMTIVGLLSAIAAFILICKIDIKFFIEHNWQTDLSFTGIMTFIFFGTFSGMVAAVVAGVFFSLLLFISKLFVSIDTQEKQ